MTLVTTIFYLVWLSAVLALLYLIWRNGAHNIRRLEQTLMDSTLGRAKAAEKASEAAQIAADAAHQLVVMLMEKKSSD